MSVPGDHPDFFRREPPPGQSRESSLRLDASGRFWHDGELVTHPKMARAFASWVRRHPDNGRYVLSNGFDWVYLEVEDAPCSVRALNAVDGQIELELASGEIERLDPETLRIGPNSALYAQVRQGTLPARFTPHAQLQLAEWLVEGPGGVVLLEMAGRRYALPST